MTFERKVFRPVHGHIGILVRGRAGLLPGRHLHVGGLLHVAAGPAAAGEARDVAVGPGLRSREFK